MVICMTFSQIACHRSSSKEGLERRLKSLLQHHSKSKSSSVLDNVSSGVSFEGESLSVQNKRTVLDSVAGGHPTAVEYFAADARLPWECGGNVTWRDLGETFFPRHISETICPETTCFFGHYACRPVIQTLKVLQLREDSIQQRNLPQSLRRHWTLAEVETTAFCQCAR